MRNTTYQALCEVAEIQAIETPIEWQRFAGEKSLAKTSYDERLLSALRVMLDHVPQVAETEKIDRVFIDTLIHGLDQRLQNELDAILHAPAFQALSSRWESLSYLVKQTASNANIKIELLEVSQQALAEDFSESVEITQSGLYQHLYVDEYDTPGGEPFSSIISDFEFCASTTDIQTLSSVAEVAALAHCPFIANIGPAFFGKKTLDDVFSITDLEQTLEQAHYIPWRAFRETDAARYIGLTFPKFLLRLPYGEQNPVKEFFYEETVHHAMEDYTWGAASFAFAANMTRCFQAEGWTVNIRGSQSGGKVSGLPLHYYQGLGEHPKIPTQALISETRELALSNLGFIPLSYYKNTNQACFFSANALQKPAVFSDPHVTANSRINSRLPYIFLSARIAHYLKVLQRETIGGHETRTGLEDKLNAWLRRLVTRMPNPEPEIMATHPLKDGQVEVLAVEDNPGFYRVNLHISPHFQIEGVDVRLSLVSQLPRGGE